MSGVCAQGWERVRAVFTRNIRSRLEVGASVCIFHRGRCVLNLTGGSFNNAGSEPEYDESTLQGRGHVAPPESIGLTRMQVVFSCTKGIAAICIGMCVERGLLQFHDPVSMYWPEFAAAGKSSITIAHVLSHAWGMHSLDGGPLSLPQAIGGTFDGSCEVLRRIAVSRPSHAAGCASGYHGHSGGYVLGEVIRRVTGCNFGDFAAKQLASPLGVEFYCGLPSALVTSRVTKCNLGWPDKERSPLQNTHAADAESPHNLTSGQLQRILAVMEKGSLGYASLTLNGAFRQNMAGVFNRPDVLEAQLPSVNGITNARSLAKIYSAVMLPTEDSPQILSSKTLGIMRSRVTAPRGADAVLHVPLEFGMGFMVGGELPWEKHASGSSFGHTGAGGCVSFGDVQNELAFAYTPNKMQPGLLGDYRSVELIESAYACLASQRLSPSASSAAAASKL